MQSLQSSVAQRQEAFITFKLGANVCQLLLHPFFFQFARAAYMIYAYNMKKKTKTVMGTIELFDGCIVMRCDMRCGRRIHAILASDTSNNVQFLRSAINTLSPRIDLFSKQQTQKARVNPRV
jgi:hypothetical protein